MFTILLLTGILVLLAGQIAVLIRFGIGLRDAEQRARADLQQSLTSFLTPAKEGEPSPLAVLADQMAIILAGRLMQQLQQRMAGISSGQARGELSEQAAALGEMSPWAGILAGILPKRFRNQLLRNPQMVTQLGLFGHGNNHTEGDQGESVAERIRRG